MSRAPSKRTQLGDHVAIAGDAAVCWLVLPAVCGLLLRPAFGYVGTSFVVAWAVSITLATIAYARFRRRSGGQTLFLAAGALMLLPLIIFVVVAIALSSCNCNVGG